MASEQADPEASKMDFSNKDHFDGFLEERNSHVQSGEKGCEETQQSCQQPGQDDSYYALAVVGIGCRMPGGTDTPSKFWDVIREGRNVITEIPPERWSLEAYHSTDPHQSGTHVTRKAGFVDDIDMFDHTFFKISPREAAMMDPQQRHLLEVTYEAFEDAGITPESVSESCGVFVGIGMMDYALFMAGDKHLFNSYVNTGIAHSVAANRISYAFNLKGPSLAVDTACAASMTALHIACSSLRNKECSVALVGGSNVLLMPEVTVAFSAMGVLSPDGFSCPFDASANGYVRSEGFGAVLIKPLSDAIRDRDHVYSIIRGSAISDNGFSHSITMPSSSAQEQLMRTTYARFGVPLSDVLYVEAHGTSTPVGDPAEAEAIGNAFGPHRASPMRIGSAKSNFGHMECAAGMVGVIKTALMLDKRTLCPSVNYTSPTPKTDFEELGISVQTKVENFPDNQIVKLGVNCFGFGGALAHVIMEEHNATPPVAPTHHRRGWQFGPSDQEGDFIILPLSGKSSDALRDLSSKWLTFQDEKDALSVSSWVATRRNHYQNRLAVVTNSGAKTREGLQCFANKMATDDVITGTSQNARPEVCFVFPGQGQQWDDMGRKLYQLEPVFRETVDACDQIFTQVSGWSLMQKAGLFTTSDGPAAPAEFTLAEMKVSQPAILFTQVGLFALLKHWGISPDVIVGHSLGEVAAAYACGGLTLDEAIRAIYIRSTEQAKLQGCGSMAAMRASRIEAEELVAKSQGVKLACDNSPTSVTVAGTTEAIAALQDQNPTKVKMLRVSCAFHTDHMDPIRESFLEAMSSVQPDRDGEDPAPLYSTVTGQHYTGRFDGQYWWKNIRGEVKFTSAIRSIIQDHNPDVFIELGASATLLSSVSQTLKHENCPMKVTVPCGQRQQNDHKCMLRALATLYVNGMDINWTNVTQDAAEWTPAPTYAWQHQRHWQEAESSRKRRLGLEDRTFKGQNGHITLEKFPFLADHVVNDSVVFPGAGYIEYMVQMAVDSSDNPTLQDIQFKNVLVWPDVSDLNKSNATIHLTYTKEGRKLEVATDRVHAGCLLTQPSNVSSESIMETTPTEAMEKVTGQNFYERFSDLGLMYGPEFQVVNEAFVGDWKAIGFLKPATDAQQRVQTTTLDGCFQVALAAIGPCSTLYLPTQITTFSMPVPSLPLGEHMVVHATVVSRSSMSVKANIILATVQGNVLAQIDGFEATNVSGINSDVDTDSCLYETRWQPVISPLPETSIFCSLFKEDHLQKQYSDEMEMIEAAEKALPNLKRLALSYVQLALDTVPDAEVSPRNKKYIERLRTIIDDVDKSAFDTMSLDEIHKSLDEMRKDVPAMRLEFSMLQRLGDILPTILRDPSAALPILFAADCLAAYFMDSLTTRLYYRACTDAIEQAVKTALERKQTVRILEVGGRMGGLARYLLKPLKDQGDAGHIEYVFTDLNTTFFAHASQVLEDYAFVKYQQLDIEKAVEPQDFIPGTFDIVICMDTLHSAVDVMEGLKNMQSLLCPGGWLVMFEATNAFYMCEVVFGSLELCWVYDDDYRTDACWLSREGWSNLFEDGGMHDRARLQEGQTLLIHSACGGVGQAAIQVAGMVGARVFCTAGSEEKRSYLRQMGMTHVSDSRSTQFYHDVMEWTDGEGVDVVLSSLYGDLQTATMKSLKAGGTFCEIGKRSILEGVGMDMGPLLNNKTFLSVQLDLLMKERAKYVRKMMETICSLLEKRHIAPVLTTVKTIDDYKETFRWMSKGQHVGKVVFKMPVKFEPESLVPSSHILEANGTYLITGGFGGVGQSLARWLVDHGAKHIALLSRNGCKTAENVHSVEYMESKGGKVYTYEADVSNKTSLTNVLNHLRADPSVPALKGIFHLAAVIDDANVLDVKDSQLEKSLAAKAWGALHLHELTQDDDLDIFFLLSSVTAAWGNPEQCGYVAANSILDALAEHRHRRGLPALSLQLGAVRGVGILEGNTKAAKIVTGKGMLTLHIDECLQMLPRLLRARDTPVVTLANMDWAKCMQFSYTTSMKFRHLAAGKNKEKSVDADLNEDDLREQVLEQLGQILCMPPSQIDPDQPMINYGVDSLMAVDIVNWMNKNFDLSVSQLDILGGMTTTTLVGKAVVGEVALPLRK
uniref:Uncharacterized protein n=1 Tax=Branchiostoma floridae TaxID=7739 RepID=C3Y0X7_BRAFL|eukprot:XP_002610100.1 hypothetical protein BRAFLDRAFT_89867 [Branchiostoma floridae]